jgi:predicted nucleic acid-binding protein
VRLIDTNILIDALIDQRTPTRPASIALLERIKTGRERVAITELALSEAVFILGLGRIGRLSRSTIAGILSPIVESEAGELDNKEIWQRS